VGIWWWAWLTRSEQFTGAHIHRKWGHGGSPGRLATILIRPGGVSAARRPCSSKRGRSFRAGSPGSSANQARSIDRTGTSFRSPGSNFGWPQQVASTGFRSKRDVIPYGVAIVPASAGKASWAVTHWSGKTSHARVNVRAPGTTLFVCRCPPTRLDAAVRQPREKLPAGLSWPGAGRADHRRWHPAGGWVKVVAAKPGATPATGGKAALAHRRPGPGCLISASITGPYRSKETITSKEHRGPVGDHGRGRSRRDVGLGGSSLFQRRRRQKNTKGRTRRGP